MTKKKEKVKNVAFGATLAASAAAGMGAYMNNDSNHDDEHFVVADEALHSGDHLLNAKEKIVKHGKVHAADKENKNLKAVKEQVTVELLKSKLANFNNHIQNI